MIRLIKADIYRLLRTKGFYITIALIIGFTALIVSSQAYGGVGVDVGDLEAIGPIQWNLTNAIQMATMFSSLLVYLLIGLFVILIGYEFSQQTYKNSLTAGVSRLSFIVAKYVIQLSCFICSTILYFGTASIVAAIKYGIGDTNLLSFIGSTLILSLVFSLLISVVFSIASLILVSTNSVVLSAVFVVVYPLAIQILEVLTEWKGLEYLDFFGLVQQIGFGVLTTKELMPYMGVSVVLIGLALVGSAFIIGKKEL